MFSAATSLRNVARVARPARSVISARSATPRSANISARLQPITRAYSDAANAKPAEGAEEAAKSGDVGADAEKVKSLEEKIKSLEVRDIPQFITTQSPLSSSILNWREREKASFGPSC